MSGRKFKQGDRVQWSAFGVTGGSGTVENVVPKKRMHVGGAGAVVVVKWDNGYVGSVEDRVLVHIQKKAKP